VSKGVDPGAIGAELDVEAKGAILSSRTVAHAGCR
jgi:hypothetical protein